MTSPRTNKPATGPRLGNPTRLPTLHDTERAAWTAGWWHGKVVGICLGMGAAVLLGWLK